MAIRLGNECIECGKEADDRCPHCGEPVHRWRPKPMKVDNSLKYEDIGAVPLPCYDQHRETRS